MKILRKAMRMSKVSLPVGLIGENNNFAYGYDGEKYYVTENSILDYLVTKTYLTFDEAKQLFDALTFNNEHAPAPTKVTRLIKSARKQKLNNDNLFWHFVEGLR